MFAVLRSWSFLAGPVIRASLVLRYFEQHEHASRARRMGGRTPMIRHRAGFGVETFKRGTSQLEEGT